MREMGAERGLHRAKMLEQSANHALVDICDSLSILDMESVDAQA